MSNTRYPHYAVVYRETLDIEATEQSVGREILLRCECNSHATTGGRYTRGEVNMSNFIMNIPRHTVRIIAGDMVEVRLPDRVVVGEVVDSIVSNMSAYIFYNEFKQ